MWSFHVLIYTVQHPVTADDESFLITKDLISELEDT